MEVVISLLLHHSSHLSVSVFKKIASMRYLGILVDESRVKLARNHLGRDCPPMLNFGGIANNAPFMPVKVSFILLMKMINDQFHPSIWGLTHFPYLSHPS